MYTLIIFLAILFTIVALICYCCCVVAVRSNRIDEENLNRTSNLSKEGE